LQAKCCNGFWSLGILTVFDGGNKIWHNLIRSTSSISLGGAFS
jgi:hypothetical protein